MAAGTPIAIGDAFRITFFQTLFGTRVLNVFFMRCTVAPTGGVSYFSGVQALADRMGDDTKQPVLGWLPLVGDELEFDYVRAQRVWPTRDIYAQKHMGLDGSHTEPATTTNAAVSVEKRTLTFGRQGVGRMQLGGIPEGTIIAGKLEGGYSVAVQTWADTFLGDISAGSGLGTYRFCLFNGTAPTEDDDYFDMIVQDTARVMYRRTLRVGE